ncbi:uncharacterized protein TRIADDRAFT_27346, partial [Trichoplax adhaerens]
ALGMLAYITDLRCVEPIKTQQIEAEGHDLESLLYHFLDEFLFLFSAEPFFIAKNVKILKFDKENFRITAEGVGEIFDLSRHPQGTEVKAITYSNMQIFDSINKHECYVIVDI